MKRWIEYVLNEKTHPFPRVVSILSERFPKCKSYFKYFQHSQYYIQKYQKIQRGTTFHFASVLENLFNHPIFRDKSNNLKLCNLSQQSLISTSIISLRNLGGWLLHKYELIKYSKSKKVWVQKCVGKFGEDLTFYYNNFPILSELPCSPNTEEHADYKVHRL